MLVIESSVYIDQRHEPSVLCYSSLTAGSTTFPYWYVRRSRLEELRAAPLLFEDEDAVARFWASYRLLPGKQLAYSREATPEEVVLNMVCDSRWAGPKV